MPTPEEYAAARLAARSAAYREQVARLRQLVTPPAYLDARRDLTTHPRNDERGNRGGRMSRTSVVTVTWACDACGYEAPEVDGYAPRGWHQMAVALVTAQLGNTSAKHLCEDCSDVVSRLLDHRLGDTGDMAIAWDEGAAAFSEGRGSGANPYRTVTA